MPQTVEDYKTSSDGSTCLQSILAKAGQQHVLGSMEENDPDADEELDKGDDGDEAENEDGLGEAADDLADALSKQVRIE